MGVNRIKNIDEIVTQSGTVVDLNNIQATGGGASSSTTVVTAGGLAISKTETADEIGYHFSVEIPTPKADGHSSSASRLMLVAGHDGSGAISITEYKVFASNADGVQFGTVDDPRYNLKGASDGSQLMSVGGWKGSNAANICCLTSFASNSVSTDHGDLMSASENPAATSNTDKVLIAGGWNSSNLSQIQMKSFADNSTAVDAQSMTHNTRACQSVSDGTNALIMGGWHSSDATGRVDHKQFETEEDATSWAGMTSGRAWGMAGSNGTIAMYCGGYTGSTQDDCYQLLFADQSTCVDHGLLNSNKSDGGQGSDGNQLLMAGSTPAANTCCMKQFDDDADAVDWGTISVGRRTPAAGSGTA